MEEEGEAGAQMSVGRAVKKPGLVERAAEAVAVDLAIPMKKASLFQSFRQMAKMPVEWEKNPLATVVHHLDSRSVG